MKEFTRARGVIIIFFALFVIASTTFVAREIVIGPRSSFVGFDLGMQDSYGGVLIGESNGYVIKELGDPILKSGTFNLPQRKGFEKLFEAAERSSAVEHYLWINGSNWYYCIGFDSRGEIVIKGEGYS